MTFTLTDEEREDLASTVEGLTPSHLVEMQEVLGEIVAERFREVREAVESLQPVPTWKVVERLAYKSAKDDALRIIREAEGVER